MLMVSQNISTASKKLKNIFFIPIVLPYILFISSDFIKQILQCSKNPVSYKVIHLARGCSMLSYSLEELSLWSFSLPKYHRPLGCSIIVVSVSFAETQRMLCKTVKMTLSKDKS